jgi:HSP20 family protein
VAKRIIHHTHTSLHLVEVSDSSSHIDWVPNTDIYENENAFVIRMEVAGVNREDIQINISDRNLVVGGRRPDSCGPGRRHFRQMEINYGTFERRLVLPRSIDTKRVKASCRNGFLIIELPKNAKSDPTPLKVMIEED